MIFPWDSGKQIVFFLVDSWHVSLCLFRIRRNNKLLVLFDINTCCKSLNAKMKKDGPEKTRRSRYNNRCIIRKNGKVPLQWGAPLTINPINKPYITWIYKWVLNSIQTPFLKGLQQGGVKQFKQPAGATIPRVPAIHNQSDLMEVESHESCLDGLNVFFGGKTAIFRRDFISSTIPGYSRGQNISMVGLI